MDTVPPCSWKPLEPPRAAEPEASGTTCERPPEQRFTFDDFVVRKLAQP